MGEGRLFFAKPENTFCESVQRVCVRVWISLEGTGSGRMKTFPPLCIRQKNAFFFPNSLSTKKRANEAENEQEAEEETQHQNESGGDSLLSMGSVFFSLLFLRRRLFFFLSFSLCLGMVSFSSRRVFFISSRSRICGRCVRICVCVCLYIYMERKARVRVCADFRGFMHFLKGSEREREKG